MSSVELRRLSGSRDQADEALIAADVGPAFTQDLIDRMKDQDLFAHVNLLKGERSHLAELASQLL